jgi:hypothetical protein
MDLPVGYRTTTNQYASLLIRHELVLERVAKLERALEAIRDHGETHDQPCYAITNGDCADVMQDIAQEALSD